MEWRKLVGWSKGHRTALVVIASILVLAGADLILNRPEGEGIQWFSVPLLGVGLTLLALVFWPTAKPGPRSPSDTLGRRLLSRLTLDGRLTPFFPLFGVVLIAGDLAYNVFVSATSKLLTTDQVVLLFGGTLIVYRFVPERYARERDFAFLFTGALALILVVPLLIARLLVGSQALSVDTYSSYALAPQTSAVLNLLGIRNSIVSVAGETGPGLDFFTRSQAHVTVVITAACSGIYSFAIFASAFSAFVLTDQRKLTRRVALFFALGVFLAYLANILRMVAIVVIGWAYDTPSTGVSYLLVAHSNAGWLIFLGWIALFWLLLFRFLPREEIAPGVERIPSAPRRRGTFCPICGIVLTPAIPATRCQCGRIYHLECLVAEGRCPNCSAPSPSPYPAVDHPTA